MSRFSHNRMYNVYYRQDQHNFFKNIFPYPFEPLLDCVDKFDMSYTTDSSELFKDFSFLTFVKIKDSDKHNIVEFYNNEGTINTFKMLKKKKESNNATSK